MPYVASADPHAFTSTDAGKPSRRLSLLAPTDSADLSTYARALRIWVPSTLASATVRVTPIHAADGETVDLTFPTGLTYEPTGVRRLHATGTTAGLLIHGYID